MNRYNFEDNNFRSTSKRSLETRNLALWNAFLIIPIRFPVAEISSRKEKDNFLIIIYPSSSSSLSRISRFTYLFQISQATNAIARNRIRTSRKRCGSLDHEPIRVIFVTRWVCEKYLSACISVTDRDIGIRQIGISMACFPLSFHRTFIIFEIFNLILAIFNFERSKFSL